MSLLPNLQISEIFHAPDLTIAVRSLLAETVLAAMSIQPQQKLAVDVRALLTEQKADVNSTFAEGSVAVYFVGTMMPLAGQLTMANAALGLVHESEMVEKRPGAERHSWRSERLVVGNRERAGREHHALKYSGTAGHG